MTNPAATMSSVIPTSGTVCVSACSACKGSSGPATIASGGGVDQRCGLLGEMLIGRLKTTRDNYKIGARSIRSQTVGRLGIGGCTKCMGHRMNLLPHFVRSPKMDWALLILGGAFGIAAVAIVLWGRSRK